tara:strand:- start:573 stop:2579 length:2007 start_codon:yes stop_codon:yes gene_type:complete
MANTIKVKFEAQGAKALKTAIDQLAVAQTRLNDGTKKAELLQKKLNKELEKYGKSGAPLATRSTRLLDNAFATLRSKLLLASFGFSLVAGSIGKTLKAFGEQERAILKLNNALGFNSDLLQKQASQLQNLTGIGDEVIINSQSILASFVRNEEAISELTKTTLDLSVALGIDLNSSANLLGKTIGSTTNSLSRYGIAVTGAANSNERIASVMKSVNLLFGGMAEAAGSQTTGALMKLSASLGDFLEKIGELLVKLGVINVIDLLTLSFKGLGVAVDSTLKFIGLNNAEVSKAIELSSEIVKSHNAEMQGIKSLNSITEVRAALDAKRIELNNRIDLGLKNNTQAINENGKSQQNSNSILKDFKANYVSISGIVETGADRFEKNSESQEGMAAAMEKTAETSKVLALTEKELIALEAKFQEMRAAGIKQENERTISTIKLMEAQGVFTETQASLFEIDEKRNLAQEQLNAGLINHIQLKTIENNLAVKEIKILEQRDKNRDASHQKMMKIASETSKALKLNANDAANVEYALAMINAYKTASNTHALLSKTLPPPLPMILSGVEFAAQVTNANQIRKQSIGQFEYGGLVGGNRHSAGGTIIEAERGEFVMSRSAVDSIGVNNLEAMNAGGGAGININISGNVMSDQFVEEELAERISEAVRKGVDFGMS